ncbi:MAG TPA: ABC transporter substrate-binding protein [Bordetella sp.]
MQRIVLKTLAASLAGAFFALPAYAATQVEFYYPVAVGGPITKIVDDLAAQFNKENPDIVIKPVYSGTYQDTIAKALTALKGGTPPQLAVLLSTDMFTLIDEDAIAPIDSLAQSDDDKKWLGGFYDAFMANTRANGHTWGVPFQRSTIVAYYNKDLFKEAGLDPEQGPATWAELVDDAKKLTKKDASGNVTQWGVEIPSSGGYGYWMLQALATPNDALLMNQAGTETYLNKPAVVEAAQYWYDLAYKQGVMPKGTTEWATIPKDFLEKKAAIVWTTTGNLTNIATNASFPFGVAMMPKNKRGGSPTGGGNFYVFKQGTPAQQQAALKFAKWATSPEHAADWGIATGYVAVTPAAWETPKMQAYVQKLPAAAVARDQLAVSVAEFSTHDNQRVTKVVNDAMQAIMTDAKKPRQALDDAQKEAGRLLKSYQ